MKRKLFFLVLLFAVFLSAPAYARTKEEIVKPITIDDIVAKMKAQLGLTDAQLLQVKPIVANYMQEEAQLRLQEKQQLKKVLTDQQLYTWNFLLNDVSKDKKKKKAF